MTEISKAIKMIKEAENEADSLVNNSQVKSEEIIENARDNSNNLTKEIKTSAQEQADDIIFKSEEDARKEANSITFNAKNEMVSVKDNAMVNVDEAASFIVKNIL